MAALERPDQRLIAAIGYVFTPVVPALVLATGLKQDARMRLHAWQALLWAAPFLALLAGTVVLAIALLRADFLFVCLLPAVFVLPFLPGVIWARRVYLGGDARTPLAGIAQRLAGR